MNFDSLKQKLLQMWSQGKGALGNTQQASQQWLQNIAPVQQRVQSQPSASLQFPQWQGIQQNAQQMAAPVQSALSPYYQKLMSFFGR